MNQNGAGRDGSGEKAVLWWFRKTGICLILVGLGVVLLDVFWHYQKYGLFTVLEFVVAVSAAIFLFFYFTDADCVANFFACYMVFSFLFIILPEIISVFALLPIYEVVWGAGGALLVIWGLLRVLFPQKTLKIRKDPSLLYKANLVFNGILFRDKHLIISSNYIMSARNKSIIINTNDVFLVHIEGLQINNFTASKRLILELATGSMKINIAGTKEEQILRMVNALVLCCPNVHVGLNEDNETYLRQQRRRRKWDNGQSERARATETEKAQKQVAYSKILENDNFQGLEHGNVGNADIYSIRYPVEHQIIRDTFFHGSSNELNMMLSSNGLFRLYNTFFHKAGMNNPYKPEDFEVTARALDKKTMYVCAVLPEPEVEPLCYRMYFVIDMENNQPKALYTVEKSREGGTFGGYLCQWNGKQHSVINQLVEPRWKENIEMKKSEEFHIITKLYQEFNN